MKKTVIHGIRLNLIWIGFLLIRSVTAQDSPMNYLQKQWTLLKPWLSDTLAIRAEREFQPHRLDTLFDWEEIAHRALRDNWINLSKTAQKSFTQNVRLKILRGLSDYLLRHPQSIRHLDLRWKDEEISSNRAKVFIDRMADPDMESIQIRLIRQQEYWKIVDYRSERFSLFRDYFRGLDSLLNEGYHPDYVLAVMTGAESFPVENFSTSSPDGFPLQWGWRKKDDRRIRRSSNSYFVTGPDSNRYLQIYLSDVMLVKPFSLNIHVYPILRWRWRLQPVTEKVLLSGERPLASLTVIFYQNWIGSPVTISYIWHAGNARCSSIKERLWFSDRYAVILRGRSDISGEWLEEWVQPARDFERFYGYPPPSQIVGVYLQLHSPSSLFLEVDDIYVNRSGAQSFSCP